MTTAGGFVQDGAAIGSGTGASGGLSIMTRATADMRFYTDGHTNERMRITSAGNVCVGSTDSGVSGTIDLSVGLAGTTTGGITLWSTTTGSHSLGFGDGTTGTDRYEGYIEYDHNDNSMEIATNHTVAMTIDSSGNVGIGTTSPTDYYSGADNLVVSQASGEGGISIVTANDTTGALYFADGTSGDAEYRGGIAYVHTAGTDLLNLVSGGATKMSITSGGDVGIGITSPEKNLSIGSSQAEGIQFTFDATNNYRNQILNYWNSTADSRMDFNIARSSGATPATIMSVGYNSNVGIGTTSPDGALHVARTSYPETTELLAHFQAGVNGATSYLANRYVLIENTFTGAAYPSAALVFKNVGDAATNNVFYSSISNDAAGGISFQTAGLQASVAVGTTIGTTEKMNISNTGDVDIGGGGIAACRLTARGSTNDSSAHALEAAQSSGATIFAVRNDKKVAINTSAANYTFAVYGDLATFGTVLQNVSATGNGLLVDSTDGTNSYVAGGFRTNAGVYKCVIYGNGDLANVNGSYGVYSDIKLKENIEDATPKLEDVCKLKVRNFDLKETKENQIGFVAQELEEVFPSLVYETDDTQDKEDGSIEKTGEKTKAIKSSVLVPILVKAIQELEARVKELENK